MEKNDEDLSAINSMIEKLLSVIGQVFEYINNIIIISTIPTIHSKKQGTLVPLTENEIKLLITKCKEIFTKQPVFLELEGPISILGIDIIYIIIQVIFMDNIMIY